jgi:hypothetical protein
LGPLGSYRRVLEAARQHLDGFDQGAYLVL